MPKHPGGRPTKFSKKLADQICERLADGETLTKICESDRMPSRATIYYWLADGNHKEFFDNYRTALDLQVDSWVDEMFDIADDGKNDYSEDKDGNRIVNYDHIKRSALRVSLRQWNAARRSPKKYGDRSAVEMSGPNGAPINPVQIYLPSNGREKSKEASGN